MCFASLALMLLECYRMLFDVFLVQLGASFWTFWGSLERSGSSFRFSRAFGDPLGGHVRKILAARSISTDFLYTRSSKMKPFWAQVGAMLHRSRHIFGYFSCLSGHFWDHEVELRLGRHLRLIFAQFWRWSWEARRHFRIVNNGSESTSAILH